MEEKITELLSTFGLSNWVIQVFLVVFFTLLFAYISHRILLRLEGQFQKTKNLWDDAFVVSVRAPVRVLVWVLGFTFAVEIIHKESELALFTAVYPLRDVAVIAIISWFVDRFIKQMRLDLIKRKEKEGAPLDRTTVDAVVKILRAAVAITAVLIGLQTLGVSIGGVLAFGGVGGIAIGFAAKDLLANFFGALMIYLDKPFKVGEWIRSPDKNIEGTVEEIGWRQTRIRTFDKRPLYVPNSTFSTIAVENPSRMTHRRIYETIGVRYDDVGVIDGIVKDVKAMLAKHKDIDAKQTMIVNVNAFSESSVDFFVYTFTKTTDWIKFHEIKQDVLLTIESIIQKHGAQIAFPTSVLHLEGNEADTPLAPTKTKSAAKKKDV